MAKLLGDIALSFESFKAIDSTLKQFRTSAFRALASRERFNKVNRELLHLIEKEKDPCFLLPQVLDYISKINSGKFLDDELSFVNFEFWLNRFSKLSLDDEMKIRAKISGRYLPRQEYQTLFPIGMRKTFDGSHFVAAHLSPDIDTTIASFWSWLDALSAKVSVGVHQWSLPGNFPDSHFKFMFQEIFGEGIFDIVPRRGTRLTLTAQDLVKKDMQKVSGDTPTSSLEHSHLGKAIMYVDRDGHYLGDWRAADAEACRLIVMLFSNCLRWFQNTVHAKLVSTFAKKEIHLKDIQEVEKPIFSTEIKDCDPVKEYNERQKKHLHEYLKKILSVKKGINSTFSELLQDLDAIVKNRFSSFRAVYETLKEKSLFNKAGSLIEDRPTIFKSLEKIISELNSAIQHVRTHIDRLDVMMSVKEKVLNSPSIFVTLKSDVDELRSKIDNLEYVTVVIPEVKNKWFPIGIVHANDLRKQVLGTVSLRDFSNEEETKMASYLEIISVVDHHKSDLKTSLASTCVIGDSQASNTLIAELSIALNKKYSFLGLSKDTIEKQIKKTSLSHEKELKQLSRLISLKLNAQKKDGFFVHPKREYIEYYCYLYAILDDTDLLTKLSHRDVECVVNLLNRMKSISMQQDQEIISIDDIEQNDDFVRTAATRILQNKDMYSIYKKIYAFKEEEVENNLAACVSGKPSTIFADTKEQNGCCRVGQTKLFSTNFPLFQKHASELRSLWLSSAKKVYEAKNQVDFHLHMISTIAGADEVYNGNMGNWKHQDEMWFWTPPTQTAMERLIFFLNAFHSTPAVQENKMSVEFLGENAHELEQIFEQNFPKAQIKPSGKKQAGLPIAVLRFLPGTINSRKAMITPYLPRLVP